MNFKKKTCPRVSRWKLVLLCLLALGNQTRAKNLESTDKVHREANEKALQENTKAINESLKETSKRDESSLNQATSESANASESYRKSTSSIADKKISNDTSVFRPSVHLGEIEESRRRTNPFNKVQHLKFDNSVDLSSQREQFKNYKEDQSGSVDRGVFENVPEIVHQNEEGTESNGRIKFQEEDSEVPRIQYENVLKDQLFVQPVTENTGSQYEVVDQPIFQNLEKPVYEVSSFVKPTKFQSESQKHGLGASAGYDGLRSPYLGFHDYHNYHPALHGYEAVKKPDNSVVYVQESSFTRTRKFPYSYYQAPIGYHGIEFPDDAHSVAAYPRRRISPWKKILHLIGAFLPLGLLLATLTPNVVKIDNTTQPNIVLSKLRIADLPVEHKQARIVDEATKLCEERSVCELILAGGKAGSNVLQNVLWNLAARTSEKAAKENGLREVFEAAKKADCTKITC